MIETKDLILRSGRETDWESLFECFWSKPEVFTFMFQKPCPTPELAQKKTAAYAGMHSQVPTEFFVCLKETERAIGIAGLKEMGPGVFTVTDIAIGPEYFRRGYGRQILHGLTGLGKELGAKTILFNCFRENQASKNLALACGFRYVRTEEAELKKNGDVVWMDYFEIAV